MHGMSTAPRGSMLALGMLAATTLVACPEPSDGPEPDARDARADATGPGDVDAGPADTSTDGMPPDDGGELPPTPDADVGPADGMDEIADDATGPSPCVQQLAEQEPEQKDNPEILGVCDDENLTVVFTSHRDGEPLELAPGEPSFTLARLAPADEPAANGVEVSRPHWQSYINAMEDPGQGDWPEDEPKLQAGTEGGGELTEVAEGVYSYRFATDVRNVTDPVEVPWKPEQTHRVGIEFRGEGLEDPPIPNPIHTWEPASGDTEDIETHAVADTASCNECHGGLELHGGPRTEVKYCVTCHNPGSIDANSGRSVDFPRMIHKIHMGEDLPSVAEGGESYTIWGFMDFSHDYSHVGYPQTQQNCRKCHDPAEDMTPEASRAFNEPTGQTCGSCHDDVVFDAGEDEVDSGDYPDWKVAHPTGAVSDDQCAVCHGEDQDAAVPKVHATRFETPNNPELRGTAQTVSYEIMDVTLVDGTQPEVTFAISVGGERIDVTSPPEGVQLGFLPTMDVIWAGPEGDVDSPADWNNVGNGEPVGQPITTSINFGLSGQLVDNGDGSFTAPAGSLPEIPADAAMAAISIEGNLLVDVDGDGNVGDAEDEDDDAMGAGAEEISGDQALHTIEAVGPPRRQIVSIDKCNDCHERLSLHGGHRTNNPDACASCHTPNATDITKRPATGGDDPIDMADNFDDFDATGVDGLRERSIDFKRLIHAVHAGEFRQEGYVVYGFTRSPHDFGEVGYPRSLGDCSSCHVDDSEALPTPTNALATTFESAQDASTPSDLAPASDDVNARSPTGSACTGCHDKDPAMAHAKTGEADRQMGFHGGYVEDCATCHGPGSLVDVQVVHGGGGE